MDTGVQTPWGNLGNFWATFRPIFLRKLDTGIKAPWGPFPLLKIMPEGTAKILGQRLDNLSG